MWGWLSLLSPSILYPQVLVLVLQKHLTVPQMCICPLCEHQPSLINVSAAVAAEWLPCKHPVLQPGQLCIFIWELSLLM